MSDSLRPQRGQPTRLPHPWDSPGKNTGVGCHFLLQCMKVKSECEVCLTLSDPMDCSLPGSSVHGIFQARVLEWGAIAFSGNMVRDYKCGGEPIHLPVRLPPAVPKNQGVSQAFWRLSGRGLDTSSFQAPLCIWACWNAKSYKIRVCFKSLYFAN